MTTNTAQTTRWQRLLDFLYIKPWRELGQTGLNRFGWGLLRALVWVGLGAGLGVGIYFTAPAMAFMGVAAALAPYFWAGAAGMALTSLFMFAHAWCQRGKGRMGWYRAKLGLAAIFISPLLAAAGLLIPGLLGAKGLLAALAAKIGAGVMGEVLAYYVIPAAVALLVSAVTSLGLGRLVALWRGAVTHAELMQVLKSRGTSDAQVALWISQQQDRLTAAMRNTASNWHFALPMAFQSLKIEAAMELLSIEGVDLNVESQLVGTSSIGYALTNSHIRQHERFPALIKAMLEKSETIHFYESIDQVGQYCGATPWHMVVAVHTVQVLKLFLENTDAMAAVNTVENSAGEVPLVYALREERYLHVFLMLMNEQVDVSPLWMRDDASGKDQRDLSLLHEKWGLTQGSDEEEVLKDPSSDADDCQSLVRKLMMYHMLKDPQLSIDLQSAFTDAAGNQNRNEVIRVCGLGSEDAQKIREASNEQYGDLIRGLLSAKIDYEIGECVRKIRGASQASSPEEVLGSGEASTRQIVGALAGDAGDAYESVPSAQEIESNFEALITAIKPSKNNESSIDTRCADALSGMPESLRQKVVNHTGENGHTPLGTALMLNNASAVDALLGEADIDVSQTSNGIVPLTLALRRCGQDVVNKLMGMAGIDLNAADQETGRTAWMAAAGSSSVRQCDNQKVARDQHNPWSMLMQAVKDHQKASQIEWDQKDAKGCTVWHDVLRSGNRAAICGLKELPGAVSCLHEGPVFEGNVHKTPLLLLVPGEQPAEDDSEKLQIWERKRILSAYFIHHLHLGDNVKLSNWFRSFGDETQVARHYLQAFALNAQMASTDTTAVQSGSEMVDDPQAQLKQFCAKICGAGGGDAALTATADMWLDLTAENEDQVAQDAVKWLKEGPSQAVTSAPGAATGPGI